jgi:cytochrome c oxidase assembly protein subunit 15
VLAILVIIWSVKASKIGGSPLFHVAKWIPLGLTVTQIVLGVFATLTSYKAIPQGWGEFEWFAQLHQLGGILLLLSLTFLIYILKNAKA